MNLRDRAFDRELAALLFEQARAFHQLALVDLPLGLRRIEQRQRRNRERAVPPRLPRLRIGQWQRRVLHRLGPLAPSQAAGGLRRHARLPRWLPDARARVRRASSRRRQQARPSRPSCACLASSAFRWRARRRSSSQFANAPNMRELLERLTCVADENIRPSENCVDEDDREEQQREDDDDRSGPVQVFGHPRREPFAEIAARAERLARHVDAAERQAQQRAEAAEEQAERRRALCIARRAPGTRTSASR